MTDTVERVDRLENALMKLAYAQFNTEMEIQELSKGNAEEIGERDEAQGARSAATETYQIDRRGSEHRATQRFARAAIYSAFPKEMSAFKDEMARFKEEVRNDQRAMNKRWGEISNKMGTIVEDIIYPSVRGIAREHFGAPEEMEFEGQRIKRRRAAGDRREFDGVFVWEGHVLLLEAKATVRPEYLAAFDEFVRTGAFFHYFPEYAGRRLIPVFSTLALTETEVAWLTERRLYAVAMGEDAMELLNAEAVERP
jgi:hypothetical protein